MLSHDAERFIDQARRSVDSTLDAILPPGEHPPVPIHDAMRYSVFAGGKRLRPALCLAGYEVFRPDSRRVLPVAAAIELIHTYSLIHDDLPSMDDDDFRRGQPSCHRQYGEALAILAGDGLLTLAFHTVAGTSEFAPERLLTVTRMLSGAAGSAQGMIAGQVMDLAAQDAPVGAGELESIHKAKTGALLEASIAIGAYLAEADESALDAIGSFGRSVGLAFQIVDDILDETAEVATLGKTPGKDRRQGKATYPGVHGIDRSWTMVGRLTADARRSARQLGEGGLLLIGLADSLESRVR